MLRATMAIDSPIERTTLSSTFIPLKKTSVQAKPGMKKTNMNPRSILIIGNRSRKGKANPNSSLSQSTCNISCPQIFQLG